MKKLLMAAVAVSSLATTPAFAAGTDYTVSGTVAPVCSISGAGTAKIDFGNLTNASTGAFSVQIANPSVNDTAAYCNQAGTTVSVTHSAMMTGTSSTGFANTVDFTSSISTAQHTAPILGNVSGVALGAFTTLTVAATAIDPGSPLVAGDYTGKITVTLSPQS